jgi:hypothetical protein
MKHLKLLLRSLIKNDACVEGGRTYPWWVAVIFFFLSTAISLIPTTVSLFTVDAGVTITQATYDSDKGFYQTLKAMEADGIDLEFYNEHTQEGFKDLKDAEGKKVLPYAKLTADWKHKDVNGNNVPYVITETVITKYESTVTSEDGKTTFTTTIEETKEVPIFKLYVFDQLEQAELGSKINVILQGNNPYVNDEDPSLPKNKNNTTFVIFGKNSFVWMKFNAKKTLTTEEELENGYSPVGQLTATYRDITSVKSLLELKQPTLTETVTKTATFLNEGFNEIKLNNAGIQISIYLAINAGMVLLMGFVLWLMTRGKNNPFRCYKIIETMKISTWTAFTPAVLSMLLGFIIGSTNALAGFMFVLVFGVRSMWLAMKNFKPTKTQ